MPRSDKTNEKRQSMEDTRMKSAETLAARMDRRIETDSRPEPLSSNDQQRLEQQQLDVNRTSDTDPLDEMRRWSSAKREDNDR